MTDSAKMSERLAECQHKCTELVLEVRRLRKQIAALDWEPITEARLPHVGDEVMGYDPAEAIPTIHLRSVSRGLELVRNAVPKDRDWERLGYTHFRPINAPKPE